MFDDNENAHFVNKPRRDPRKWKNKWDNGDGFSHKAKKRYKHREQELYEESLDEDLRDIDKNDF